jgi:hypothetical protein
MSLGRPWHALQQQAFAMADSEDPVARENTFRVFAGSPNLIMDLHTESVLAVLQKGLQDQNVEVSGFPRFCLAALWGCLLLQRSLEPSLHRHHNTCQWRGNALQVGGDDRA